MAAEYLLLHHPLGDGRGFTLAIGVFWLGKIEGVMTFGSPISCAAVSRYRLRQCDVMELRKMWLSDVPPKMTESRCLAIAAKLIREHYPRLILMLTYCDGDESAASYKGAGWISQDAHRYVREVFVDGRWYSVRNANRKGITKLATEKKYEYRRKWIYPLKSEWRDKIIPVKVNRAGSDTSDTPVVQTGEGGSRPTPALQAGMSTL